MIYCTAVNKDSTSK